MKVFKRCKTYDEIEAQCKDQGLHFDNSNYLGGGDFVQISRNAGASEYVIYNLASGFFFGMSDTVGEFSSDRPENDGELWFDALLNFFYSEDTEK